MTLIYLLLTEVLSFSPMYVNVLTMTLTMIQETSLPLTVFMSPSPIYK